MLPRKMFTDPVERLCLCRDSYVNFLHLNSFIALMANDSTLKHSKTLGKTQFQNFSTLTSTLAETKVLRA
jgi:hypothetical protein